MVAPGLCDRVASPGEGLSICSCRSAMYHISPRFARESFVFAKKCGESAHTSPAKPLTARWIENSVQTGDGFPIFLLSGAMMAAAAGAVMLLLKRRKLMGE